MANILLKDVLNFDQLRKDYPNKQIKLRFNTSWTDKKDNGEALDRDYLALYKSKNPEDKNFFADSIMSSKSRIKHNEIIFQFVQIRAHVWILIDAVNITNTNRAEKGYNDFTEKEFEVAEGETLERYKPFFNRLIVNWVNINRNFFYTAEEIINRVEVREILVNDYLKADEEFCGYERVSKSYEALKMVIDKPSWKEALSNVYGVYVLTDAETGKLYVGSATGENGIFGRWSTYLEKGYDNEGSGSKDYPNKKLKELVKKEGIEYIQRNFQYSLLEIFPKTEVGKDRALERESYWKGVLKSRECGYNCN